MKQSSAEKYNVAWFKLAEFVSRGEKERALAMYRLLAHSLEDQAFISQLEGDLLLAFHDDELAYERYGLAVRQYAEQGKAMEAASVFEHMVTLEPITYMQLQVLTDVYKKLSQESRVFEATQHCMRWLMNKKEFIKVSTMLEDLEMHGTNPFALIHQELVQAWLKIDQPPTEPVMKHIKKTIDHYFLAKQQKPLQTFLMTLKMLHGILYQQACGYMQEGNIKL